MGHNEISCSYCTCKKHNKIAPSHVSLNVEFVEVHPKRKFRVIHTLPFSYKCKKEEESTPSSVQPEKYDITSSSEEASYKNGSVGHRRIDKINCVSCCCCGNTDSVIPKLSFLLRFAENVSSGIITEAIRLVSHRKRSVVSSESLNSRQFHCLNVDCINSECEKTTNHSSRRSKRELKCSGAETSSSVPVFNTSRRDMLSKRLNCLIFFIHGLGGSADVWQYQLMFFSSQGYEVVAFDLLGHGMSSAPNVQEMYAFPEMLNDLLLIFDHYAKQRNVVVGHSYGSGIEQGKSSHLMELVRISALPRYVLKYVLQGQRWEQGDRIFYRSLYCPTLLVYGSKDCFVSLHDEIEMEKTMPYARLEVISTAGHSVMVDAPNELNELIFRFLLTWKA